MRNSKDKALKKDKVLDSAKEKELKTKKTSTKSSSQVNVKKSLNKNTKKSDKKTTTKKDKKSTITKTKKVETKKKPTTKAKSNDKVKSKTKTKAKSNKKTELKNSKKAAVKEINKNIKISSNDVFIIGEYYDLPYRYNQTTVKILAQDPNTLFVYWDISDEDRENFLKTYGDDFYYKTKPVLVIHNLSSDYTFEIDINDFANNWYVKVNDTKARYVAELGRRKVQETDFINVDFLNISYSNTIEMPNDKVLFFKNHDKIHFKNIKTNEIDEVEIHLDSELHSNLERLYGSFELDNNTCRLTNPSSLSSSRI